MNQPPYGMPPGAGGPPPGGGVPPGAGGPPPGGGMPPGGGGFNPPPYGYAPQQGMPPQPHYQPPQPPAPSPTQFDAQGFFAGLLDLSFTNFVTTRVIKVLYVIWLLLLAFGALAGLGGAVIAMVRGEILQGIFMLVVLPFALVAYLILGRMWHELIIVMFRIAENIAELNRKTRG